MGVTLDRDGLLRLSLQELDALFRAGHGGPIPDGAADGTALLAPGTAFSHEIATLVNVFAWQGKTFDAAHGTLTNRISPFGLNAIVADVYEAPSWLDGKPCVVLDYSKTSLIAHWVRDEIRRIAPALYLGKMYWERAPLVHFTLEFRAAPV